MEFKVVTSFKEFLEMKDDWNRLVSRIETPEVFYSHEWVSAFLQYYAPSMQETMAFVCGYEKEALVIVLPFSVVDKTASFITPLTVDYNNVYVDAACNRYLALRDALEFFLLHFDVLRFSLEEVPSSSELFILQKLLEMKGFRVFLKESNMCSSIMAGTEFSRFNKSTYKRLSRKERQLEENYRTEILDQTELTEEIYSFIACEKKNSFGVDDMYHESTKAFYQELFATLGNRFYLSVVRLNGKIAAAHVGFCTERKFYYYVPVYNKEFRSSAVGGILLKHLVEKHTPDRDFDFLRGDEDYKFDWCDNARANFNLTAYRKDAGRLVILKERLKNSAKVRELLGK